MLSILRLQEVNKPLYALVFSILLLTDMLHASIEKRSQHRSTSRLHTSYVWLARSDKSGRQVVKGGGSELALIGSEDFVFAFKIMKTSSAQWLGHYGNKKGVEAR